MKRSIFNLFTLMSGMSALLLTYSCKPGKVGSAVDADAAKKVYVAPGKYDEVYAFLSGGFSGQVAAYGIPSGRLLKVKIGRASCRERV